jgi:hypothetical protein
MGLWSRGVGVVKGLLRKLVLRVPGVLRLNGLKNTVLHSLERLLEQQKLLLERQERMQERLISLQASTLEALVCLLERRREQAPAHMHTQVLQQFADLREQLEALKGQHLREAISRRSA